jgi:carbamoyltransferase
MVAHGPRSSSVPSDLMAHGHTGDDSLQRRPLTAGIGGPHSHASVALCAGTDVLGVCAQESITRTRGAGVNATGLPDEALDCMLERIGRRQATIERFVIPDERLKISKPGRVERLDHHYSHACTSFLSSPFSTATIVVIDAESPKVSVWKGTPDSVERVEWPWRGPGLTDLHRACASAFGFDTVAGEQRLEALARLGSGGEAKPLEWRLDDDGGALILPSDHIGRLEAAIAAAPSTDDAPGATAASNVARTMGALFEELLAKVHRRAPSEHLCLGGSFFFNSAINSIARESGTFSQVFVPVNPGNGGVAVGAALAVNAGHQQQLSPFLGPSFAPDEIKATLDNCKLHYEWTTDEEAIVCAVDALRKGRLVGWFEGAMEWGPRALGARSILADPSAPYVLENLNRFLKHREPWRGYGLSGPESAVRQHFDGPAESPFMECDYRPKSPETFRAVLPSPRASIRIQSVAQAVPPRFRRLLDAFGTATGLPFLVNTSFNGKHEPLVCSPADAVRVFYGTGMDVLILDRFILTK